MLRLEVLYINFWGATNKNHSSKNSNLGELDDAFPVRLEPKLCDHPKLDFRAQWEHHLLVPWTQRHLCVYCDLSSYKMSEYQVTHIVLWFFRSHIVESNLRHSMLSLLI